MAGEGVVGDRDIPAADELVGVRDPTGSRAQPALDHQPDRDHRSTVDVDRFGRLGNPGIRASARSADAFTAGGSTLP